MQEQGTSRLTQAILQTADGMHGNGILDDSAHAKITLRHLGQPASNVTTGSVSQLERGTNRTTKAVLALRKIIRRKGLAVVP